MSLDSERDPDHAERLARLTPESRAFHERAAAGLKMLEILDSGTVYDHIDRLGEKLFAGLQEVADDVSIAANVQHIGSMGQVYMTDHEIARYRDTWHANEEQFADWWLEAAASGVLFGNPMQGERFFTTATHTDDQMSRR